MAKDSLMSVEDHPKRAERSDAQIQDDVAESLQWLKDHTGDLLAIIHWLRQTKPFEWRVAAVVSGGLKGDANHLTGYAYEQALSCYCLAIGILSEKERAKSQNG
mgnify:CR=1 FL=1